MFTFPLCECHCFVTVSLNYDHSNATLLSLSYHNYVASGNHLYNVDLSYKSDWPHGVACGTNHIFIAEKSEANFHIHDWQGRWVGWVEQSSNVINGLWVTEQDQLISATTYRGYTHSLRAYQVSAAYRYAIW
jgi:hypothetical protein